MQRLTIQEKGSDRVWTHDCAEDEVTIGRLDSNIVQLKSDGVSRRHAKLVSDGSNLFIVDLKSGNGTAVNGTRITPQEKNLLKNGDVVSIDNFDLRIEDVMSGVDAAIEEEVTESDIIEVKLLKKVLNALDKEMVPSLEVLNGSSEGGKVFFSDDMTELTIGRDPDCDFTINEHVMSRKHAKVVKRWGGIAIRDLESKNGTFVNNRRVVEEFLHDGDRIALGTIVIIFRNPQEFNLAALDDIKPKTRPAPVTPEDIPGIESEAPPEQEAPPETQEEASALEEWDELEKSISKIIPYPEPKHKIEAIKKLAPMEIGMIGLGVLVFIFAFIMIVNLLAS